MKKFRIDEFGNKTTFTEVEDDFLNANYLKIPVKTICKIIDRSSCGIRGRLQQLNLIIPQELADQRKAEGMFRKGQEPPNKGRKQIEYMSPEAIERTKATRFQKKHIPHNAKENGTEVQRKDSSGYLYWMIKLPENRKLVYKHIWMWEKENGKIQPGYNVIFKNGISLDCRIENLECISNASLMERNTMHRFPEELRKIIQLKGALNRQINKQIKNQNHG